MGVASPAKPHPASCRILSTTSGFARVDTSPGSCRLEIAASTRRMILPERVFGMSGTITTRRGRAMAPMPLTTDWVIQGNRGSAQMPQPVTGMICPVMPAEASPARNTTALAMSSRRVHFFRSLGFIASTLDAVSTSPGAIALTRMP